MSAFKPMGKIIVVAGKDGREAALLRRILSYGGRANPAVSDSAGGSPDAAPAVLLLAGRPVAVSRAAKFAVCVAEYSLAREGGLADLENTVTYSVDQDGADFTARNIRLTQEGLAAFEIVGVGIIGRVRLKTGSTDAVGPALAAATAAIAAGVPFAEVLEALNGIEIDRL